MFNKSEIMRSAWSIVRTFKEYTFSQALKLAWAGAKAEKNAAGIENSFKVVRAGEVELKGRTVKTSRDNFEGIAAKTLRRARENLKIICTKEKGADKSWYWELAKEKPLKEILEI